MKTPASSWPAGETINGLVAVPSKQRCSRINPNSGIERLSECGLDSVEESQGVRDAVEGQNTCTVIQLSDLLLQSLLKLSDSTHLRFLLGSDLLLYIRASFLQQTDQLSEDLLTVLHCFISRAIDGLHK
ncbi:unnamed protein product [Pleuronectes platessa]|uniref:Uncharacterized protein n=1 Tax=Pleuronectes platessa TaxID=8262 RepID=A0A9N7Y821_PLEPL|nr:unnamed protein product [Pleuronectes platessa]